MNARLAHGKANFGTAPVFLTAISTILGAIMFLRFGYAVGHLGFLGALAIILIGHAVTIPTAMAIAEIATNQKVEGGGEYYIISRSFGMVPGAAIGIALFLSQAALAAPVLAQRAPEDSTSHRLREALRHRLEAPIGLSAAGESVHTAASTTGFYETRLFAPAWISAEGEFDAVDQLLQAISSAWQEGLEPADYHVAAIAESLQRVRTSQSQDVGALADLELLSTDAFLLLASHYLSGHLDPETIDPEWKAGRRRSDVVGLLERALNEGAVHPALRSMLPPQQGYARLRQLLDRYRKLAATGSWPVIPAGPAPRPGVRGENVELLRARLLASGDIEPASPDAVDLFDAGLQEAVERFQGLHGLQVDGLVGPATRDALNVLPAQRLRQIRVNLERWRWLPEELGRRHVLVNIAGFDLQAVTEGRTDLDMRVIVGRNYRRTPVFSDWITYLVFHPSWEIPAKLAVQDLLPQMRKDPSYTERMGIRVLQGWGADEVEVDPATVRWNEVSGSRFPYRLRQKPGPLNALGLVKFMFPNAYNVYLHDTPARELFARPQRDLSSGCIRVEQPQELSQWLLSETQGWDSARIGAVFDGHQETTVRLATPVNVHLLYWTVWVDEAGAPHFRKDLYGRDARVDAALSEAPPTPED